MITDVEEALFQQQRYPSLCAVQPHVPIQYGEKAYMLPRDDSVWKRYVDQWLHLHLHLHQADGSYRALARQWRAATAPLAGGRPRLKARGKRQAFTLYAGLKVIADRGHYRTFRAPIAVTGAITSRDVVAIGEAVGIHLYICAFQAAVPRPQIGAQRCVQERHGRHAGGVFVIRPLLTDITDAGAYADAIIKAVIAPEGCGLVGGNIRGMAVIAVYGVFKANVIKRIAGKGAQARRDLVMGLKLNSL